MIHYHGTPITPRTQLEAMAGRHFCVPFSDPRDAVTALRIGQSVMFDNGAYTVFTKGGRFDTAGYDRWLAPILAHPHWAVVPDVIDGSVEQQRELVQQWTYGRHLGAPVWHLGLPESYLFELLDAGWLRVCLGSSGQYWNVGSPAWCGRMDEVFNALERAGCRAWIHGMRMLGQLDGGWPLASADSSNVAQNWKRDAGSAETKAAPIDARQPAARWTLRAVQGALF